MAELPSGTVAFLFTDIEGSTSKWQQAPRAMATAVARHDALLRAAIEDHGGRVFKTVGDAFCAVFATVLPAVSAAMAGQRALVEEPWGELGILRVRMAVHVGDAEERDADYFGPAVNRVARLLATGHGGQILLSHSATELVRDHVSHIAQLRDLGEHFLKDFVRPERIFQLITSGLPVDFPPLVTPDHHQDNLPPQLTGFVGREREVAAVTDQLARDDVRLVTITGPGGVGKTRLSLQVASGFAESQPQGVWFVPLEETTDEAEVVAAVAFALGVREAAGQPLSASVSEYLRDKHLLLLLDNFEQVAHTAGLVSRLLRAAPSIKILITSRARLGLQGEREYVVLPLDLPDRRTTVPLNELIHCSAVKLFVERAQATHSAFELNEGNASAVTEICHGLDALPLAIELAAARIKLLPPEAMLARIERRLGLLTGGRGDRPSRHQTLQATITWSYDLLTPDERTLFARLSVFAPGFTLDAVETVCNPDGNLDVLLILESLVDHSLIRQVEDEAGDLRFSMLATIREFAVDRLTATDDAPAAYARHVLWCLNLLEKAESALIGPEQQGWLDRLEREHDNLRAALAWTAASDRGVELIRLAGAMYRFWAMRGHLSEGRRWLDIALKPGQDIPTDLHAKALYGLACLMVDQGDDDQALALHERSLLLRRAQGDPHGTAESLSGLANTRFRLGDYAQSAALFEESLALFRQIDDAWGAAGAISGLAAVTREQHDYQRAQILYEEGLASFETFGDQRNIAISLNSLATVAHDRKDYVRAMALYNRSLAITRALGDKRTTAITTNNQAIVAHDQGEYAQATALYEKSLALFRDLGDRRGIAFLLLGLGIVADDQGDHARAIEFHNESLELFRKMGDKRGASSALAGQAAAAYHLEDTDRAEHLYLQALDQFLESDDEEGIVECLDGIAGVSLIRGQTERAVRLYAVAALLHDTDEMSLTPAKQAEYDRLIAVARESMGPTAFFETWESGQTLSLDQAVAEVRQSHAPSGFREA